MIGKSALFAALAAVVLITVSHAKPPEPSPFSVSPKSGPSAIGPLSFDAGYPDTATAELLFDQMHFQRAVQTYIWGTAYVNAMGLLKGFGEHGVTPENRHMLVFPYRAGPQHIGMTWNETTPYFFFIMDLGKDGPIVVDFPGGEILAHFVDFKMRGIGEVGAVGPDGGKGGKYLLLPPNHDGDVPDGYYVYRSRSNLVFMYGRALREGIEGDDVLTTLETIVFYPLADAKNPPARATQVSIKEEKFDSDWPKDIGFWDYLFEVMNRDVVEAIDKPFHDWMMPLGYTHGEPFEPNEKQKEILAKAARVGAAMMVNLAYNNAERNPTARWWDDREWETIVSVTTADMETDTTLELTDRASNWYQITMNAAYLYGRTEPLIGEGTNYVSGFRDGDGDYLDGGRNYKLTVPANVPARRFWASTVYSNASRSFVQTDQRIATRD
ncbi:MAG: DUF1254 domain-containing protein, partial [Hyphomicrobiaceae bacterium]